MRGGRLAGQLATGLGGSLLLPFLVELGMASMLGQHFSLQRSAIFVGVLAGGSGLLLAIDRIVEYRRHRAEARAEAELERVAPEHVAHHAMTVYGSETDGVVALCAARLGLSSLHYVAYHARGKGLFRVDVLDHPDMAPLVGLAPPDRHREIYENYGTRLKALMTHLDDDFDELDAHLTRIAAGHAPFKIRLRGAETFRPVSPVVYVALEAGAEQCAALESELRVGALRAEARFPFHPHITVAHDLDEAALDAAQAAMTRYEAVFDVTHVHRFVYDGTAWRPARRFLLGAVGTADAPEDDRT